MKWTKRQSCQLDDPRQMVKGMGGAISGQRAPGDRCHGAHHARRHSQDPEVLHAPITGLRVVHNIAPRWHTFAHRTCARRDWFGLSVRTCSATDAPLTISPTQDNDDVGLSGAMLKKTKTSKGAMSNKRRADQTVVFYRLPRADSAAAPLAVPRDPAHI